jgi:hypothetical protein
MSKKKWLIALAAAVALGVVAVSLVCFGLIIGFFIGHQAVAAREGQSAFQCNQTASAHPGYRLTTLTNPSDTYVNDYEEQGLQLMTAEPRPVIGRYGLGGMVCAIPGQPTTAYIAADVGSEMPAYEVFRNIKQPAFNWQSATFGEMQITLPDTGRTVLRSKDPQLLAAVIRTLREGAAGQPATAVAGNLKGLSTIYLYSEQLPGLAYCPSVYFDPDGSIYVSENISIQPSKAFTTVTARWVHADRKVADWLTAR